MRKRKADGKNKILPPSEPTFVENEPSSHDGQGLGHSHSKFWGMDAFAAADSTSFSPSVGRIPKLYGHRKRSLPSGNVDNRATDSQESEEENAILSLGTSVIGTDYGYAAPLDPVLIRENAETATLPNHDLREVLLGADAFVGYISPSTDDNAPATFSEDSKITLTADDPGSSLLLPAASSPERTAYPDNPCEECSGGITELEVTTTNYPVIPISSLDAVDEFFAASGGHDFISTESRSTSDDLELSVLDSMAECLDSDLGSLPDFTNVPDYMTAILDEHSAFYESLLLQAEEPIGDSIDVDFCLRTGADHVVFILTGFEFCE